MAAGSFELVLKVGVFVGGQVERGSVSHEAKRDVVGEEVCEEGIAETHDAAEEVCEEDEGDLDCEVAPKEDLAGIGLTGGKGDDLVNEELGDVEEGNGEESEGGAADERRKSVERAGAPDFGEERWEVAEGLGAVAPGLQFFVSPSFAHLPIVISLVEFAVPKQRKPAKRLGLAGSTLMFNGRIDSNGMAPVKISVIGVYGLEVAKSTNFTYFL